jgi:hypothetical protein
MATNPILDEAQRQGRSNSFGDAAAASLDSRVAQIPTGGIKAPAADGSQNSALNTGLGREVTNTLSSIPGAAGVPGAAARGVGLVGRAFGAAQAAAPAAQAVGPYVPVVGGGAALASAANANGPRPPAASPSPGAQSPNPLVSAAMEQGGPAGAPATPSPSPQPQNQLMSGVYQHGRGQYSDQAGGMGLSSTFTGRPNAQNMAAADTLAGQHGLVSYAAQPSPTGPASSNSVPLIEAAGIRHSGNDWAARQNLKNLETSASSITNRPGFYATRQAWSSREPAAGPATPDVLAYQQALATDAALQQAQPAMAQAAMRENAGLQREGMQQAGADRRSLVSAMLDQQKINQAGAAAGYTNRAAAQTEQLRGVLLDPNATQQQRQSAQQALMTLSGHQPADPYLVVPGGQQIEPNSGKAYNTPSTVFNRSTGQFVQQPGQGAQPPAKESLVRGQVYQTPRGQARWNGEAFDLV